MNLLDVRGLCVFHGAFQALHAVDLELREGEVLAIVGANGAGKTSLLRALMGQVERSEGSVRWRGEVIDALPTPQRVARGMALVPEGRRLFPSLTVAENLGIGATLGARRRAPQGAATVQRPGFTLEDVLTLFPALRPLTRRLARQLSGGQQQMVAIGRALLMRPTLLMCDEISLGLAPVVIEEMYVGLSRIRQRGIGLLVVEQDLGRALSVADRFVCLLEGRITLGGRPQDIERAEIERHYFGLAAPGGAPHALPLEQAASV